MLGDPGAGGAVDQEVLGHQVGLERIAVGPQGMGSDFAITRAKVGQSQRELDQLARPASAPALLGFVGGWLAQPPSPAAAEPAVDAVGGDAGGHREDEENESD